MGVSIEFIISSVISLCSLVFFVATYFQKVVTLEKRVSDLEENKFEVTLTRIDEKLTQLASYSEETGRIYQDAINKMNAQLDKLDERMDEANKRIAVIEAVKNA